MVDDFTEDFDDDPLPEEFQEEALVTPGVPSKKPVVAPKAKTVKLQREQVQTQAPASAPVETEQVRFVPFELPTRMGIFDNTTGKPLMEESPKSTDKLDLLMAKLDVIFGAVTELMNKVNDLEKNI